MMNSGSVILVEGNDDVHAIIHVLKKRGAFVEGQTELFDSKGWDKLLASVPVRLKSSAQTSIGIVADADTQLALRWRELSRAIQPFVRIGLPQCLPADGFVGERSDGLKVGVWLMPNNRDNGALEDFLLSFVDDSDPVLRRARSVVEGLVQPDMRFGPAAKRKAVAHTFLAWQETPGRPLGLAVNFNYFNARAERAGSFEAWYRQLIG